MSGAVAANNKQAAIERGEGRGSTRSRLVQRPSRAATAQSRLAEGIRPLVWQAAPGRQARRALDRFLDGVGNVPSEPLMHKRWREDYENRHDVHKFVSEETNHGGILSAQSRQHRGVRNFKV